MFEEKLVIYKPQDKQFLRRDQRGLRLPRIGIDSQPCEGHKWPLFLASTTKSRPIFQIKRPLFLEKETKLSLPMLLDEEEDIAADLDKLGEDVILLLATPPPMKLFCKGEEEAGKTATLSGTPPLFLPGTMLLFV